MTRTKRTRAERLAIRQAARVLVERGEHELAATMFGLLGESYVPTHVLYS